MNGMKGIDQNTLSVQIKSLMIYEFLNEYNRLEQIIREIFEKSISSLPVNVVQQFYFYNGGRIGTFIDFEEDAVKLNVVKYRENELFKEIKINQIIGEEKDFADNQLSIQEIAAINEVNGWEKEAEQIQETVTKTFVVYDVIKNDLFFELTDEIKKDRQLFSDYASHVLNIMAVQP